MQLPNINTFNGLELQVLRGQMQKGGSTFRQAFDEWLLSATQTTKTAEERLHFYKDQVRPAAALMAEELHKTKLISRIRGGKGEEHRMDVLIGEVPLQTIWDFYNTVQALKPETHAALQTDEAREYGKQRVPVMVVASPNGLELVNLATNTVSEQSTDTTPTDAEGPVSVRKRLSID